MALVGLKVAGFYGKSVTNTCDTPQPGRNGVMEVLQTFQATKDQEVYDLSITFSSAADKISICNIDLAGNPERRFTVDVPLDLLPLLTASLSSLGSARVIVGSHANGMIEFFFASPAPALVSDETGATSTGKPDISLQRVTETLDVNDADLSGSRFNDANLSGCSFNQVNFFGARLNDCNMTGWQVQDANLSGAVFENLNLSGAVLTNCRTAGVIIDGVLLDDMIAAYRRTTGA